MATVVAAQQQAAVATPPAGTTSPTTDQAEQTVSAQSASGSGLTPAPAHQSTAPTTPAPLAPKSVVVLPTIPAAVLPTPAGITTAPVVTPASLSTLPPASLSTSSRSNAPSAPTVSQVSSVAAPVVAAAVAYLEGLQQQASLISTDWELVSLGSQIGALNGVTLPTSAPLGPELQSLIVKLRALSASDPSAQAILVSLQELGSAAPTSSSTIERIILLNRLLNDLARVDPKAAQALASTLPAFDTLVRGLIQDERNPFLASPGATLPAGSSPLAIGEPLGAAVLLAAGEFATEPVVTPISPSNGLARKVTHSASPLPAPPSPVAPVPLPAPIGGGGSSAAGAGGAASASSTVLSVAGLNLPRLNSVAQRLELDLAPWRSMLLASRLERPG